ncbi:hypothetical protein Patl1_18884 [Pistacia atlantica]|uniref:Uncharacterized protein n=1 Tax=Pistacia atlantica TaxID=434234 RepID=A0ACC1BZ31_9ROSI|nr:hypothetical protein Patl1_18884 [Pistacia atlantica]
MVCQNQAQGEKARLDRWQIRTTNWGTDGSKERDIPRLRNLLMLELQFLMNRILQSANEIHPLGAFHNVKNEKAVAPPGVWTSEDHDQTYNAGTAVRQYSSEVNNELIDGHYFPLKFVKEH